MPPIPAVSWEISQEARQRSWDEMYEFFTHIVDRLGTHIDQGIIDLVVALNIHGFHTRQSCAGHTTKERRSNCEPWVEIKPIPAPESEALERELDELFDRIKALEKVTAERDVEVALYLAYDRTHEITTIIRRPILQDHLRILRLLKEFYSSREIDFLTQIAVTEQGRGFRLQPHGSPTLDILSVEEQATAVAAYQQEFADFCTFLKDKYFSVE